MLHQNHFHKEYEVFRESNYFQLLDQKYKPIPYYKKYRTIYGITYLATYLFNTLSGITASTLILIFVLSLTTNWYISVAISIATVLLVEILKRRLSRVIFKEWLAHKKYFVIPILVLLLVSSLSVLSSYYGSKKMVVQLSTTPDIELQDIYSLNVQLEALDGQIEAARNTRWKGTTTTTSQATIQELTAQRTEILNTILEREQQNNQTSFNIITNHEQNVQFQAEHFALVTLLLELLFWLAAYYLEYYDFRSYTEFHRIMTTNNTEEQTDDTQEKTSLSPDIDPTILIAAIKNAKANLAAYKSKLRKGNGTVAANQKGIRRWEKRLEELHELLPKNGTVKNEEDKGSDNGVATLF